MADFFRSRRLSAHIELNTTCNAMCPMCYDRNYVDDSGRLQLRGHLRPHQMTLSDIKRIFDPMFLQAYTLKKVLLCGTRSEPSLNPELNQIVSFFEAIRFPPSLFISTNGSTHNPAWWFDFGRQCADAKMPVFVIFSLDGLGDTHSVYRINTSFPQIIENATSFIAAGGRAVWQYLVFEHNQHQIDEAKQHAHTLGFSGFLLKSTNYFRKNGLDSFEFNHRGSTTVLRPSSVVVPELKPPTMRDDGRPLEPLPMIHCYSVQDSIFYLDAYGRLFPCSYLSSERLRGHAFSDEQFEFSADQPLNAIESGLSNLLQHPSWRRLADSWSSPDCPLVCSKYCANDNSNLTCHFKKDDQEFFDDQYSVL